MKLPWSTTFSFVILVEVFHGSCKPSYSRQTAVHDNIDRQSVDEEIDDSNQDSRENRILKNYSIDYLDPCLFVHCRLGRLCEVDSSGKAACVCGEADYCAGHTKPICGSDGQFYPSHCELHRMACIKDVHIKAVGGISQCFHGRSKNISHDFSQLPPQVDSSEFSSSFPRKVAMSKIVVNSGTSLELKCGTSDISGSAWRRNDKWIDSNNSEIKILTDGSLYFHELSLQHVGSYACFDANNNLINNQQLIVHLTPIVRINPSTQFHTPGEMVTLQCHADGIPTPNVSWEVNEVPLPIANGHYSLLNDNHTLLIHKVNNIVDTGAYKCRASNAAGSSQDIATVFIETSDVPRYASNGEPYQVFVTFHDSGYNVYDPRRCRIQRSVSGSFEAFRYLPDSTKLLVPTLCLLNENCLWGRAVNVLNKFIYVSQPTLNRVVVVEIGDRFDPVEIIATEVEPVEVRYVEHLDQIWVVCWNQHRDPQSNGKTFVVIQQASLSIQHKIVHIQPIGNQFDVVSDIFIPENGDLLQKWKYGYTIHSGQQQLLKLDLEKLAYIGRVDLTEASCIPQSLAFLTIGGGKIVVSCAAANSTEEEKRARSRTVVLDSITDQILDQHLLPGVSYTSPDSRVLVTFSTNASTTTAYQISSNGEITLVLHEKTDLEPAGLAFLWTKKGYDVFVSSVNKPFLLYINTASGRMEKIADVGKPMQETIWPWRMQRRPVVGSGVFGDYVMTSSADSIFIIDGRRRTVHCEWHDVTGAHVMAWVEPLHL